MQIFIYQLFFALFALGCQQAKSSVVQRQHYDLNQSEYGIVVGAERYATYHHLIENKKVALIVNQTSRIGEKHLVDTLLSLGISIGAIFSPEHGFRGNADAGETIKDSKDPNTGINIFSLYGSKKKPSKDDLAGIDIVIFDIQDVGVRFYTYISTLHYVMEACAENNIPLIVLDRPNPNAHYVDGPVLKKGFESFVGMHPVPIVYGMTIGEYAQMINGEGWLVNRLQCQLTVIKCLNYEHQTFYTLPIPPSPNLPNSLSILLYPSICLFEGTTLSLGRGTDYPFQYIGHPKILSNFSFTPKPNFGAKSPPLQNVLCFGTDLSSTTIDSLRNNPKIDLSFLIKYYNELNTQGELYFLKNNFFDKLAGSDVLRKQIMDGLPEIKIRASWADDLAKFRLTRSKYLLYK